MLRVVVKHRIASLLVVMATMLFWASPKGFAHLCAMEAPTTAMPCCCTPPQDVPQTEEQGSRLESIPCCDMSNTDGLADATRVLPRAFDDTFAVASARWHDPSRALGLAHDRTTARPRGPPPPGGPPLYVRHRSLLL